MAKHLLILFDNVNDGMNLYKALSQQNIECKVSFSPSDLEKVCGIAVEYFNVEDEEIIQKLAHQQNIKIKRFYEYSAD